MLWFVEGSGGESHLWMLSRNWFPKRMGKAPLSALMRLVDDKRFTSSTSLAVCCMDALTSSMSLAVCCTDAFISFPSKPFRI